MTVVIDNTIGLLQRSLDKKIELKSKFNAEKYIVSGDESQLQNAILNMCINSSHAMPDGGTIDITVNNSQAWHRGRWY